MNFGQAPSFKASLCARIKYLGYLTTVWLGSIIILDRKAVQRMVKTAAKMIGCSVPSVQDVAYEYCLTRICNIVMDATYPFHDHFSFWEEASCYPKQNN